MTEVKKNIKEVLNEVAKFELKKVKIYENLIKLSETEISDEILIRTVQETFKGDIINTHNFNLEIAKILNINVSEQEDKEEDIPEEEKDEVEIKKEEANKEYEAKKEKLKKEIQEKEDKELEQQIKDKAIDSDSIAKKLGLDI